MTIRRSALVLAVACCIACDSSDGSRQSGVAAPPVTAPPQPAATAAPSPAAVPAGGRTISSDARAAMKGHLTAEATGKTAWITSQPGNPEVAALVASLGSVFRDAGWQVSAETVIGLSLKPGVMTLVADEQYPSYVDAVLKALEASGLDAKSASGYRGYYDAKKQENASWPGVPIRPDQDFVIVVGPKPTG